MRKGTPLIVRLDPELKRKMDLLKKRDGVPYQYQVVSGTDQWVTAKLRKKPRAR